MERVFKSLDEFAEVRDRRPARDGKWNFSLQEELEEDDVSRRSSFEFGTIVRLSMLDRTDCF